ERIAASSLSPPSTEKLIKAFGITRENLYRLCSEIVDECVRILIGYEEFAELNFFRRKYLDQAFKTEAHRVEKQLLRQKDRATLQRFYEYVFNSLASFPVNLIDVDLMEEYGNKCHKIKENHD